MSGKMDNSKIELLSGLLGKYPVVFAYLFGSTAKDKATALSDIDIAVFLDKETSKSGRFDARLRIINELSAAAGKKVDIIVINDINVQLAHEIIKHGKVLLCKDRDARIDTETKILSKYLDRRYYDKRRADLTLKQMEIRGILQT